MLQGLNEQLLTVGVNEHVVGNIGSIENILEFLVNLPKLFFNGFPLNDCNTGKACGPDGLGNDWYRDYAATLVPILTILYRMWYEAGDFPNSFLLANIFCLKKKRNGANPLNYRPLALLNTDYKILTRLLSTKVAPTLKQRIHPHQNGFVPGRHIHNTLDSFAAAQAMAKSFPESNDAIAVLLDFAKAYDSLFREFFFAHWNNS
ncbi:Reverse transcriptase precursor [Phytophthora megakarya]|uniref:Reverse transcriptase n=1 Tax=Phytophthora megakarya TaxID=4795 RepID=A0A225W2J9_9STRA|nr:Reverse transcriptase precursor [Phytophthora megakarya]